MCLLRQLGLTTRLTRVTSQGPPAWYLVGWGLLVALGLLLPFGLALPLPVLLGLLAGLGVLLLALTPPWVWTLALILYTFFIIGRIDPGPPLISDWPVFLRWGTYLLIPLFALVHLAVRHSPGRAWRSTPIDLPLALLFLVMILSALINGSSPLLAVMAFGVYLRYPLLFLALVNSKTSETEFRRLVRIFVILVVVQVPLTVLQAFFLQELGDNVGGSLGGFGTGGLAMMIIAVQALLIARLLILGWQWRPFLLYLVLFVPIILGDAVAGVVFSLSVTGFLILRASATRRVLGILAAFAVALVLLWGLAALGTFGSTFQMVATEGPQRSLGANDYGFRPDDPTATSGATRANNLVATPWFFLSREPAKLVVGFGPNSLYNGRALGAQGPLCTQLAIGGDLVRCVSYQLPRTLLELGLTGLILGYALLVPLLVSAQRVRARTTETAWQIGILAFEGIWVLYALLAVFYLDIWREDYISILFWVMGAAIVLKERKLQPAPGEPAPR